MRTVCGADAFDKEQGERKPSAFFGTAKIGEVPSRAAFNLDSAVVTGVSGVSVLPSGIEGRRGYRWLKGSLRLRGA